jgi:hypothetical protein
VPLSDGGSSNQLSGTRNASSQSSFPLLAVEICMSRYPLGMPRRIVAAVASWPEPSQAVRVRALCNQEHRRIGKIYESLWRYISLG